MQNIAEQIQEFFLSLISTFIGQADEFRSPVFLWLLLLIPVYLFWQAWWFAPRRLMVRLSYDPEKITGSNWIAWARFIPPALQACAWFVLVLALARPQSTNEIRERKTEGVDILLLIDVSASMEETDFDPNRLEVCKRVAKKFIAGRKNDRIGIVVFAAGAYSYAPLTLDYKLLEKLIDPISPTMMNKSGTAIGTAIGIGVHRLEKSTGKSRVMILITDGASNYGELPPVTTAQLAAEHNIKIYPIAIGKAEMNGKPLDLDEPTLMKIAEVTGGTFFRGEDESKFTQVMETISSMEKTEFIEEVIRERTDVYPPLVLAGIILLAISFAFSVTFVHNPFEG